MLCTWLPTCRVWSDTAGCQRQQAALVLGQTVDIEVPALGSLPLGKLIFVADTVRSRDGRWRLRGGQRQPPAQTGDAGSHVDPGRAPVQQVNLIPAGSRCVVRDADADNVFVVAPWFRLTPVQLGPDMDGKRAVLSGLKPGSAFSCQGFSTRQRAPAQGTGMGPAADLSEPPSSAWWCNWRWWRSRADGLRPQRGAQVSVDPRHVTSNTKVQIATGPRSPEEVGLHASTVLPNPLTGLRAEEMSFPQQARPVADHPGVHRCDGCVLRPHPAAGDGRLLEIRRAPAGSVPVFALATCVLPAWARVSIHPPDHPDGDRQLTEKGLSRGASSRTGCVAPSACALDSGV